MKIDYLSIFLNLKLIFGGHFTIILRVSGEFRHYNMGFPIGKMLLTYLTTIILALK